MTSLPDPNDGVICLDDNDVHAGNNVNQRRAGDVIGFTGSDVVGITGSDVIGAVRGERRRHHFRHDTVDGDEALRRS